MRRFTSTNRLAANVLFSAVCSTAASARAYSSIGGGKSNSIGGKNSSSSSSSSNTAAVNDSENTNKNSNNNKNLPNNSNTQVVRSTSSSTSAENIDGEDSSLTTTTTTTGPGGQVTTTKRYWFSNIERKITPADPAIDQVREILLNPTDPQGTAPPNLSPIPQIGTPPGGLVVEGPHEIANPPFQPAPLLLAEEVVKPPKVLSEMELLMKAWSEEFARAYFLFTVALRFLIACVSSFLLYFYYRTVIRIERIRRGSDNTPKNLRVGCVVYFDIEEDGRSIGRIVIGLLTENCPLYCEYFHRRCTGNGGDGETFRGMRIKCMNPTSAIIFGDGKNMTHDVPGYNPKYLPTEWVAPGPWRGCLMSIPYAANQESPNFAMMINAGDFTPNVFGIVMGGYEVLEKIAAGGISHACDPRHDLVIEGCGELCTLDKSAVQPMPWRLYETVSRGMDTEKYGPKADWKLLMKGLMAGDEQTQKSWLTSLF